MISFFDFIFQKSGDESSRRNKVLDEISDIELELNELNKKLKTFQENNPETYKLLLEKINVNEIKKLGYVEFYHMIFFRH